MEGSVEERLRCPGCSTSSRSSPPRPAWALLIPVLVLFRLPSRRIRRLPAGRAWRGAAPTFFSWTGRHLVNGSPRDYERGKALRQSPQEQLFWFQRGGKEYVLRDAATLKQLQALFEPQMSLGQQQAALGAKQARLADQLTDIVARQAEQGEQQAEMDLRMSQLATEQVRLQEQGRARTRSRRRSRGWKRSSRVSKSRRLSSRSSGRDQQQQEPWASSRRTSAASRRRRPRTARSSSRRWWIRRWQRDGEAGGAPHPRPLSHTPPLRPGEGGRISGNLPPGKRRFCLSPLSPGWV